MVWSLRLARAGIFGVNWMVTLTDQVYALCMTIAAGFSMGLLFDIYRVLRSFMRPKRWGSHVADVLYWVIVAPLVFVFLLIGNWGELRYYVFIGLSLGIFVYFQIFSSFILWSLVHVAQRIGSFIAQLSGFVLSSMFAPIRFIGGQRSNVDRKIVV